MIVADFRNTTKVLKKNNYANAAADLLNRLPKVAFGIFYYFSNGFRTICIGAKADRERR